MSRQTTTPDDTAAAPPRGLLGRLDRRHTVAPRGFNRWLVPPAALAVHLCIGQVYATSVYKTSMVAHFGTGQTEIGVVFSIAIVMLGLSAAVFGTWVEKVGPRRAMFTSACAWALGFLVAAVGIATTQLWLLYLGYGVIGGIGLGIGYISPVSTLIKWFPDRPGLATGLAIMGFGGGALLASPLSRQLLQAYDASYKPSVSTSTADGHALALLFVTLGIVYFVVMMVGVANIRVPATGWQPDGFDPSRVRKAPLVSTHGVTAASAIRTPQFWLLWVVLFCNVTAGIGILEQASPMIQDFFRSGSTSSVSVAAAGGFVGLLSLFNMAGRFVWSSTSDVIGRKPVYVLYLGGGIVLYLLLALAGQTATALFVLLAALVISFYGGGFATAPAYLRDLFGTLQVGAIHGRLLTAWSAAGVAGPLVVNGFLDAQGKPGSLTAADYRPALLTMVGVLAVGLVANLLVRPVAERFHATGEQREAAAAAHDVAVDGRRRARPVSSSPGRSSSSSSRTASSRPSPPRPSSSPDSGRGGVPGGNERNRTGVRGPRGLRPSHPGTRVLVRGHLDAPGDDHGPADHHRDEDGHGHDGHRLRPLRARAHVRQPQDVRRPGRLRRVRAPPAHPGRAHRAVQRRAVDHPRGAAGLARRARLLRLLPVEPRAERRSTRYQVKKAVASTLSAKFMRWGGVTLLLFIVFHILQFTTQTINVNGQFDSPYRRYVSAFQPSVVVGSSSSTRWPWSPSPCTSGTGCGRRARPRVDRLCHRPSPRQPRRLRPRDRRVRGLHPPADLRARRRHQVTLSRRS